MTMEGVGLDMHNQILVMQSQVVGRQSIEYHAHSPFAIPTSSLYATIQGSHECVGSTGCRHGSRVASWLSSGEFIEVQSGTPRRCSIGTTHEGIPTVGGTSDSLAFGSEVPPQSLPVVALPPTGAPGSTGSLHCTPHRAIDHSAIDPALRRSH
jgi:hypothetical protein